MSGHAQRWRITMVAGPGQDPADEPRMDLMVVELTTVDPSPRAVVEYAFSPWLGDGFLVITSVEPLADPAKQEPVWLSALDRSEVTKFLVSIGYFDEQET